MRLDCSHFVTGNIIEGSVSSQALVGKKSSFAPPAIAVRDTDVFIYPATMCLLSMRPQLGSVEDCSTPSSKLQRRVERVGLDVINFCFQNAREGQLVIFEGATKPEARFFLEQLFTAPDTANVPSDLYPNYLILVCR